MAAEKFDELADIYEAMIDWPRRLNNESPFYRELFDRIGAKRVLDVACGTGHHAGLFHSWGLSVEGADLSAEMIRRCERKHGTDDRLRWAVRGFDQPVEPPGSFDVAICIGNSIALANDMQIVAATMRHMLRAVRPGGAVVIQAVNLWRLPEGPPIWQKCRRQTTAAGDMLIIKGIHRSRCTGYVDLLATRLTDGGAEMRTECVPFLGLDAYELQRIAEGAGAAGVELFGDYQRTAYAMAQSSDLIVVAIKST